MGVVEEEAEIVLVAVVREEEAVGAAVAVVDLGRSFPHTWDRRMTGRQSPANAIRRKGSHFGGVVCWHVSSKQAIELTEKKPPCYKGGSHMGSQTCCRIA